MHSPAAPSQPRTGTEKTAADLAEGADYARALLTRIAAGTAKPEELASLMQFLHRGDMLHGAAVVIFEALRRASLEGAVP